jgi:plastocyanin domain-containing protein
MQEPTAIHASYGFTPSRLMVNQYHNVVDIVKENSPCACTFLWKMLSCLAGAALERDGKSALAGA